MTQALTGPVKPAKSGNRKAVVVLLHGYGADGNDLIGLADPLADHLPDVEFRAPNAPEVFYRIVKRNGNGPPREDRSIDALLSRLECPLLLCWGESDPWIVSATADRVEQVCGALGVAARRVSIDASTPAATAV